VHYDYFLKNKPPRPVGKRGIVAPENGMGAVVAGLKAWLEKSGVKIYLSTPGEIAGNAHNIIATDAPAAADIIAAHASTIAAQLRHIQYQSLYSISCGFNEPGPIKGFGCLFPQPEGFKSYGVLFNSYIFAGRGPLYTETWILPAKNLNEINAYKAVLADRKKLIPQQSPEPQHKVITHWARALPVYDTALERMLRSLTLPPNIDLLGNYTGQLGIAKILEQAFKLAQKAQL
jgi:protoporphyrinogen oxidase